MLESLLNDESALSIRLTVDEILLARLLMRDLERVPYECICREGSPLSRLKMFMLLCVFSIALSGSFDQDSVICRQCV